MPFMDLTRILPSTIKRSDILGDPDKKSDQEETENQGHLIFPSPDNKMNPGLEIKDQNCQKQYVSVIVNKMIGEKIQIDKET